MVTLSNRCFLEKGLGLVLQAIDEDNNHSYPEALRLYRDAIDCLASALEGETTESSRDIIRHKISEYSLRIADIERHVKFPSKHDSFPDPDYFPMPTFGEALSTAIKEKLLSSSDDSESD
ncbi:hypothetical protein CONPUDRAFT_148307 [Coniophora puteana RWD-64-598 SS2]|uniref:MIT domain-containing protein n=1 Tax=Coniophora puteana (strain RWD-64-598) TaxID=741705 RepID=A0A5M3N493_CONPW|nr:uncharacterized protein CONPUDRAFT_148307 [Coniophora puteana RWD-64-598 SS2]EIW86213.1 hypothetical protein CONPUDRAFT_148307 [Coniophora puteana RWD-64-598 SS2]